MPANPLALTNGSNEVCGWPTRWSERAVQVRPMDKHGSSPCKLLP
jgi:hypothetical protein